MRRRSTNLKPSPRSSGCWPAAWGRRAVLRILHRHSSVNPGGKELRAAKLINAFGKTIEHTIVSGEPDALGAAWAIDPRIAVSYPDDFPPLTGKPLPGRLQRLAMAMKGFDLVLTYNWG